MFICIDFILQEMQHISHTKSVTWQLQNKGRRMIKKDFSKDLCKCLMCQPLIVFASIFDSGCLNNSILKSTHQILGLTIACQPLATCIFPSVLNAACICVTKMKIIMSKNNITIKIPDQATLLIAWELLLDQLVLSEAFSFT